MWDKVFKNGPSKICGRQSLKNLNQFGVIKRLTSTNFTLPNLEYFISCIIMFTTLRKKYPYSKLLWSVFSRSRTEYGPE